MHAKKLPTLLFFLLIVFTFTLLSGYTVYIYGTNDRINPGTDQLVIMKETGSFADVV